MTGSPLIGAEGRFAGTGGCVSPRVGALMPRRLAIVSALACWMALAAEAVNDGVAESDTGTLEARFGMLGSRLHAGAGTRGGTWATMPAVATLL